MHVHPPTSLPGCGSQSAHTGREAAGPLSLHTKSPGPHERQPGPRAAGKHSFITDLPHLLLSPQKAQLLEQQGSWNHLLTGMVK